MAIEESVLDTCRKRGVSRRRFMQFCGIMAATLALPKGYTQTIAAALGQRRKPVLVWLEFQDCAGNSESMLRSTHPTVEEVVLETLSWEYHETIMAGYGKHAEAALRRVVEEEKGKYLVVVEGSIPTADDGVYCTISGRTALDIAREVCGSAAATIAVGACAWDGGLPRANPNPTGAVGLHEAVPGIKIVNLPGCPHNSVNTAAVLVHYLTFNELPALDPEGRPLFAYGQLIHDQCERRANYDAGRFVQAWGDEGHRKGWCLFKMGCKVRAWLHRLRLFTLLGYKIAVLRTAAASRRLRRRCHRRRNRLVRRRRGCSSHRSPRRRPRGPRSLPPWRRQQHPSRRRKIHDGGALR